MSKSDLVKGWCPGALRPMESGDGLIVRVRPRLSRLSLVQLEVLGEAAAQFGDGSLHLSNRANVQIRGVEPASHGKALELLEASNLIDSNPRIEAIRNVMLAPQTGLGAQASVAAGLAAKLEAFLTATGALQDLPGKFGVAIQAGESIDSGAVSDVTFIVRDDSIACVLEGALDKAFMLSDTQSAIVVFAKIALYFIAVRRNNPAIRRMRDAISMMGLEAFARAAGNTAQAHRLPMTEAAAPVGDLGEGFGIAFTFGDVSPEALQEITATMRCEGVPEASISPHRALVFPVGMQEKPAFRDLALRIDGVVDPGDVRLRVHACPGAPACSRATVPVRAGAKVVIEALRAAAFSGGTVHISGCEKRCAYPHAAEITAIGTAGRYELFWRSQARCSVSGADLPAAIAELARAL